jgi:flavin-dependent dehydrogenase
VLDVAIVGGGPAGSVCAALLASRGRRVAVVERVHHPRFHLGESLLPASMPVLDALGVLDAARRRFLPKYGARFVDGHDGRRTVRYAFAEAYHARSDHALQVPRDEFDELLFRNAGARGAEVLEGWEVTRLLEAEGRARGVVARGPDGRERELEARIVVDATGRDAMIARASGATERVPHLNRTAVYTQVRGAWRDEGERAGDIQIVVVRRGQPWWLWLIPFADGRTSVGAVLSPEWLKAHAVAKGPEAIFETALSQCPAAAAMLAGSERLFEPRATADFSFRVRALHGPGWLAIGDASGFIDPLFSTGAHLAMHGALRAADVIDAALSDGDLSPSRFDDWEREMRHGAELYLGAVQAFYAGDLTSYLFAEPQHPFLRRAITTMLSGEVFDVEAPWARALRTKFPARGHEAP